MVSNIWMLLAGVALFLFGMFHIEDGLKHLEGRAFKLFLRRYTGNAFSAILSGTVVTGILQSSSIVNLMLLSFAGAGAMSMRNIMGVILGSNIGGTINTWLVVLVGFKADLGVIIFPLLALSGIALAMSRRKRQYYTIFLAIMGFGFLLLGLQLMKDSMAQLMGSIDITAYLGYNKFVLLLAGFIVTMLAQTSSATVAIVLTGLYSGLITLESSIVLVLGAELGTTIKLVIGSFGGAAVKKRLAAGNLALNLFTSLLGLLFLDQGISFIRQVIGLHDPLIILAAFQSLVNIVGAVAAGIFLTQLAAGLERLFTGREKNASQFIQNASGEIAGDPEEMLEKETGLFLYRIIRLNMSVFKMKTAPGHIKQAQAYEKLPPFSTYFAEYNVLKQAEGEMLAFYSRMLENNLEKQDLGRMGELIDAVKSAMYSAKGLKDIGHDLNEFRNSGNDFKYGLYMSVCQQQNKFYTALSSAVESGSYNKALNGLTAAINRNYEKGFNDMYKDAGGNVLKTIDISTFLNITRELYSSSQALIAALDKYGPDNKRKTAWAEKPLPAGKVSET